MYSLVGSSLLACIKSGLLATSPYYHGYHEETANSCADPEGGNGSGPPPLKKSQTHRVSKQYWSGSPKITKLPSQHSMLDHHRHAIYMTFRWRADDDPLIVVPGSSPHSSTKTTCLCWTPSDITFWIRALNLKCCTYKFLYVRPSLPHVGSYVLSQFLRPRMVHKTLFIRTSCEIGSRVVPVCWPHVPGCDRLTFKPEQCTLLR